MKKEFILAYDRDSLFSILNNHKSLTVSLGYSHTFFEYSGEHKDNGFLALAEIFDGLSSHAEFSRRHELETHAGKVHPIPYIVNQRDGDEVWQYQRGKGIGEERLAGDDSIAPGGHVEIDDASGAAPHVACLMKYVMQLDAWRDYSADLKAMIIATIREFHEEINIRPLIVGGSYNLDELFKFELLGLLFDETNEVGTVHLGLVFRLRIPEDWTITSKEAGIEDRGFKLPEKLLEDHHLGIITLESWSLIMTNRLLNERILKANAA